jgi:hypothetical protein
MSLTVAGVKLIEAGLGWAVGRLGDAAVKATFGRREAKAELVEISAESVAAALEVAPEIAADLSSQAYANHVLAPALLEVLRRRDADFEADDLARGFLSRFVEPYLRDRSMDDVLGQVFQLEPQRLQQAFAVMATTLRLACLRSKYWREPVEGAVIGEILLRVSDIHERLRPSVPSTVDLAAARKDAHFGSEGLRSWPQTISRFQLARPETEQLRRRILDNPAAATLLIGVAGSGKSALLADLAARLEADGMTVFAVKADQLRPDVANFSDISRDLGLQRPIDETISALAAVEPVVVIIDQLDAVSEVMDRSGGRMRLLLNLTRRLARDGEGGPVHVLVSSRPFEANYDARFETLEAERFPLALPSYAQVEGLLRELGTDPAVVPASLQETLRRPFLLKLFVQILERGAPTANLLHGELLSAWLASAPLGDGRERRAVLELLQAMAREMTASERLWIPADQFDLMDPDAAHRAEACELIIRNDRQLGFAHQAWLDDFQARGFSTGAALADYALSVQDRLFNRATILRGLERMRVTGGGAYGEALDTLLGDPRTRRHLRHLLVDLIASQPAPEPRETAWVRQLLQADPALARRAVAAIVSHWAGWRDALLPLVRTVLANPDLSRTAAAMAAAEIEHDPASGERLLNRFWSDPARDYEVFDIISRAKLWSPSVRARLTSVFERGDMTPWALAGFLSDLADAERFDDAIDLFTAYLSGTPFQPGSHPTLHDLDKVATAAPRAFAEVALPWFCKVVGAPAEHVAVRDQYLYSEALPTDWDDAHQDGSVFAALKTALQLTATQEPAAFLSLVARAQGIEVEEVQTVLAEGFAGGAPALADEGLRWLLADRRRFLLGRAHVDDEENVGRMVTDWSTRALLIAAAPHAARELLEEVRDALEAWDGYSAWVWKDDDARLRRERRQWAEEHRTILLDLLPPDLLSARRRRQVAEAVRRQPRLTRHARRMASFVTSPMSADAMGKATDDEIMGMLDAVPDGSDRFRRSRRRFRDGSFVEIARAFGDFALEQPARAMDLVRDRFVAGRHEYAAGELLQKVAQKGIAADTEIRGLIHELLGRGFGSESFRRDSAWAFQAIADRQGGLTPSELELVERWLVTDPEAIADRIARANLRQTQDAERNAKREPPKPHALLFGRGLGGLTILPGGNYSFLSTLAVGLLVGDTPDVEGWLGLLERHASRPEEPEVLSALLVRYGPPLFNADRARVQRLFATLWRTTPAAFDRPAEGFLWTYRELLPDDVRCAMLQRWLQSSDPALRQLGGEYAMGLALVGERDRGTEVAALAGGDEAPETQGRAFATAAGWREEGVPELRRTAHDAIVRVAPAAKGLVCEALATALPFRNPLPPDEPTRVFLRSLIVNDDLLRACLGHRLVEALQGLLLEAGFDGLVLDLAERIAETTLSSGRRMGLMVSAELVSLGVSLQRGPEDQRHRAMALYERLLDSDAYGAHEAARASLQR